MSISMARPSWWRIPSPSILVLVLLLSFMPWIEIGCESKTDLGNPLGGFGGGNIKMTPPEIGGTQVFATQSGLQIATGGYTKSGLIAGLPQGNGPGVKVGATEVKAQPGGPKDGPDAAPVMWLFFLALVGAIVTGFAMRPGRLRSLAVGGCVGAAIVVLLVQSLVLGFPGANEVTKESKAMQGVPGQEMMSFFVRYTPMYWISWVLLIGALIPLALEEMTATKIRQEGAIPEEGDYGQKFRRGDESVQPSGNDPEH